MLLTCAGRPQQIGPVGEGMRGIDLLRGLARRLFIAFSCVLLAACMGAVPLSNQVQSGQAAYQTMEVSRVQTRAGDYRLGALDTIDVSVFQEPDLSVKELEVDSSGWICTTWAGQPMRAGLGVSDA